MTSSLRKGLVSEWFLNAGQAKDTSGNGNHGTITGTTNIADQLNRDNMALSFNGSSDKITFSRVSEVAQNLDYSVSLCFKADSVADSELFSTVGGSLDMQGIRLISGNLIAYEYDGAFSGNGDAFSDTASWHHVVMTHSASDTTKIYLDGVELTASPSLAGTSTNVGTFIGASGASSNFFNGRICLARIHDRILSITEVAQVYNDIKGNYQGLFDGLVAGYDFKGDAKDWSGNGNDGTVTGATLTTDKFNIANRAYDFDGVNDYISTSRIDMSNGELTISVVINFSEVTTQKQILSQRDGVSVNNWQWYGDSVDTSKGLFIAWGSATNVFTSNTGYYETGWHNYIITTDGDTFNWYKDGILFQTQSGGANTIDNTLGSTIHIGQDHYSHFGNGKMAVPLVFNRILSSDEAKILSDLQLKKYLHTYERSSD